MSFLLTTNEGEGITWNTGESKPFVLPSNINYFEASGKELEEINYSFLNIPMTRYNKCVWRGEMALFIYDNL